MLETALKFAEWISRCNMKFTADGKWIQNGFNMYDNLFDNTESLFEFYKENPNITSNQMLIHSFDVSRDVLLKPYYWGLHEAKINNMPRIKERTELIDFIKDEEPSIYNRLFIKPN